MNLLLLGFVLFCGSLAQATIELSRMLVNVTTSNGSEFVLHHDMNDTRLYLSNPAPGDLKSRYTMVAHSRDKTTLKIDVIKFVSGQATEHYDISDMTQRLVRPVTAQVLTSLEKLCPDIHFMCKAIKDEGLRKTTQIRRKVPLKIRHLLPSFSTTYEKVVYAAMGPFFEKLEGQLPKSLVGGQSKPSKKKLEKRGAARDQEQPQVISFSISGHDRFGRAAALQASIGHDGMRMAIQSHLSSIRELHSDESYLKYDLKD